MDLLKSTAQYQHDVNNLTKQVSLAYNKDLHSIMLYIKQVVDGAAKVENYKSYYNNFSELYEYIARHKALPPKILNKWFALSQDVKNIVDNNQVSKQDILNLGMLWDAWSISNVGVLKENYVSAINNLIHKALELL